MGGTWMTQLTAVNDRYWYFATLSFLITLLWLSTANDVNKFFQLIARLFLSIVIICIPFNFKYEPKPDLNFGSYANDFKLTSQGDEFCFPVNPDDGWHTCVKRR
jgi:hypothetical protein